MCLYLRTSRYHIETSRKDRVIEAAHRRNNKIRL